MENQMFCFQCQETAGGRACTVRGVCGKTPPVAAMQDLLVYVTKGLGVVTTRLRQAGKNVPEAIDRLVTENLFVTITNANFDEEAIAARVAKTLAEKAKLRAELGEADLPDAAVWEGEREDYAAKAALVGVLRTGNEDLRSLRELTMYGLKGLAAYVKHANMLGGDSRAIDAFIQEALAKLLDDSLDAAALTALALETGASRRFQYRRLRSAGDDDGRAGSTEKSGDSYFRARSARSGNASGADGGYRRRRLYARRNAPGALLSGV